MQSLAKYFIAILCILTVISIMSEPTIITQNKIVKLHSNPVHRASLDVKGTISFTVTSLNNSMFELILTTKTGILKFKHDREINYVGKVLFYEVISEHVYVMYEIDINKSSDSLFNKYFKSLFSLIIMILTILDRNNVYTKSALICLFLYEFYLEGPNAAPKALEIIHRKLIY